MMAGPFTDKIALITGASRGLGRAMAEELGRHGAYIVGTATTASGLQTIEQNLKDNEVRGRAYQLDVSDQESLQIFAQSLESNKHMPSILINNAGINRDNLLVRMRDNEWIEVINTNLNGLYYLCKMCIRTMMKARYGRIINITSVIGLCGNAGQTNYAAAKSGIIGFTRSLAREVGSRGITVNAIAPGFIDTDMTAGLSEGLKQELLKQIPLQRFGRPEEIASVAAFLAGEQSAYISGTTINVNGGMYMG